MKYEELLDRAYKELPEVKVSSERFEIPRVQSIIQGSKTIIANFARIAQIFRRDVDHLQKYLLRELATPGEIKKSGSVIIGTKISASRINEKIRQYANEFVLCLECGKPDTKIEKEGSILFLKCTACGARHPIKSRI